jgi:hypothetical protein
LNLLWIGGHEESPFPLDEADGPALGDSVVAGTVPGTTTRSRNEAFFWGSKRGRWM